MQLEKDIDHLSSVQTEDDNTDYMCDDIMIQRDNGGRGEKVTTLLPVCKLIDPINHPKYLSLAYSNKDQPESLKSSQKYLKPLHIVTNSNNNP